jgi:hypothetical protein
MLAGKDTVHYFWLISRPWNEFLYTYLNVANNTRSSVTSANFCSLCSIVAENW